MVATPIQQAKEEARRICLELPLYGMVDPIVGEDENDLVYDVLSSGSVQFDCYCTSCKKESTFKSLRASSHAEKLQAAVEGKILKNGVFVLHMHCGRVYRHIYTYVFELFNEGIMKIGQNPSLQDIGGADLNRFRHILGKEYLFELNRANGLISHGVGIGSFVYLRRIFERLIATHREVFEKDQGIIEGFDVKRMDEKIDALKAVLPVSLVSNRATYSILSKGIHELDEDTCKDYYPIVRAAIMAMLEDDYQAREKQKKADAIAAAISAAAGKLKGPPSTA